MDSEFMMNPKNSITLLDSLQGFFCYKLQVLKCEHNYFLPGKHFFCFGDWEFFELLKLGFSIILWQTCTWFWLFWGLVLMKVSWWCIGLTLPLSNCHHYHSINWMRSHLERAFFWIEQVETEINLWIPTFICFVFFLQVSFKLLPKTCWCYFFRFFFFFFFFFLWFYIFIPYYFISWNLCDSSTKITCKIGQ